MSRSSSLRNLNKMGMDRGTWILPFLTAHYTFGFLNQSHTKGLVYDYSCSCFPLWATSPPPLPFRWMSFFAMKRPHGSLSLLSDFISRLLGHRFHFSVWLAPRRIWSKVPWHQDPDLHVHSIYSWDHWSPTHAMSSIPLAKPSKYLSYAINSDCPSTAFKFYLHRSQSPNPSQ
jgi:hypothetical protein